MTETTGLLADGRSPDHKPRLRKPWVVLAVLLVFSECLALYLFARENRVVKTAPASAKAALAERVANLPDSSQETPYHFVYAEKDEPLLLCEKETKTLFCFRSEGGKFSLFKAYRCILGANNHDKKETILLPPEHEGKMAVARFDQHYTSSNFRDHCKKLQYWRKGLGGWQIISENVF
jgi:hypothetical protein